MGNADIIFDIHVRVIALLVKPDRQHRYAFVGTKNRIGGELEFAVQSDDKARKSEELDAIRHRSTKTGSGPI